ncbi:DC-STAMP domain-containing protein 2 [Acipenser ruthenus]|uniref:DC-STAMP domain-containing protein 2 n=1 Tax=Acipenser ruthenus TaxID=7906 RepID=A0A444UT28_ACIRT|nr:DC-STAMP domain-containing protein 2 [Acipenser ruthenus]
MSPLTFEDDNEEELDSSDEEKVKLWISAMKAMKNMELEKKRELRKLLKRRIKEALRKKVDKGGQGLPKELRKRTAATQGEERSESDTSSNISSQSSDSNSPLPVLLFAAPVQIAIDINGSGYAADIYKDIVASFDVLQQANISVLSKKCQMNPAEPDYMGYLIIGGLYGMSFFIVVAGNYVTRLRRFVCASYYPSRERERICFLYNQILSKRTSLVTALMQTIKKNTADEGHTSMLMVLGAKFPGCGRLVQFMGVYQSYCMACGKVAEGKYTSVFVTCITPGCKGIPLHYLVFSFSKVYSPLTRSRKKYLFQDDYDNNYITNEFVEMDIMRAQHDKSTVLPLSQDEALKYVRPSVMAAFEKMKDEFEFNISSSSHFSMHFNKSKSIFQVAADIMEEVSVELDKFQEFIGIFGYATLFLMFYMYLQ